MRVTNILKLVGSAVLLTTLFACGSAEVTVSDDAAEEEGDAEEEEAEEEEEEEEVAEPSKAPGPGVSVDRLNAAREKHVGKEVTVSGYYMSTTKQGNPVEQLNVMVRSSPDKAADGEKVPEIMCVAKPENAEMFDGVTQKSVITVKGTVSENTFFDSTMLEDCVVSDGADAPKGGGGKKGKRGKKGKKGKKKSH